MNYNWMACVDVHLSFLNSPKDIHVKDQHTVFHVGFGPFMICVAYSPIGNSLL